MYALMIMIVFIFLLTPNPSNAPNTVPAIDPNPQTIMENISELLNSFMKGRTSNGDSVSPIKMFPVILYIITTLILY